MTTEPDKVDSGVLGTLITVLTLGVLATALAVTALVRTNADKLEAERSQTNEEFASMRGSQEADLNLPPAYIDKEKGTVRLPIDRAMQVVVRDLRRNPESATADKPEEDHANGDGSASGESAVGLDVGSQGDDKTSDKASKQDDDTRVKAPPRPKTPPKPKPAGFAPRPPQPKAPVPKKAAPLAPKPAAPPAPKPVPKPAAPPAAPMPKAPTPTP